MIYSEFISPKLLEYLKKQAKPFSDIPNLVAIGEGNEDPEAIQFLCELYDSVSAHLNKILVQRTLDRKFIDQRTRACFELNKNLRVDFLDPRYETILGQEDGNGRIVVGPKNKDYFRAKTTSQVAEIPEWLQGNHVTLFGPPDDAKLSINAMNAYHRKLADEPKIVEELLATSNNIPKWGADDEDSKTPLRKDLNAANAHLTECLNRTLTHSDGKKTYSLAKDHLAQPIKRFPGLALPSLFLFYRDNPIPLHLYDFALHLFANWKNPQALAFYVPKLENEEEAAYIRLVMETAEKIIARKNLTYKVGSIRLFIVLENPRAIFRTHEIIDALNPYFAGASLGWHDFLASTARLFKEDGNYRIPVKADPNIVIKYIQASHHLLAEVVGSRGGIKIGGMYGVLPTENHLQSPSFQMTIRGFIKDVVTQLKRDLSGFWVAHPDFVRIGLALVAAWKIYKDGDFSKLESLVKSLVAPSHHKEILEFITNPDLKGLDPENPMFARSLIVADLKESTFIANHHPEEIRYNVFQSLQYLTDWLSGNGCVALPATIEGIPVRVMDDLATAERSRWEVWHEINHGRFSLDDFIRIVHEEMRFIRKDLSDSKKIVQVKYNARTEKWYPVAMRIMLQLMTAKNPVEFATELLLPFTVDTIRNAEDPWKEALKIDAEKYQLDPYLERLNHYFSICGSLKFAATLAKNLSLDLNQAEQIIKSFDKQDILDSASFHGDIGESKQTLDETASKEQQLVLNENNSIKEQLKTRAAEYLQKFGMKFLISAQGKSGTEILTQLDQRLKNSQTQESENAKQALWEISLKRLQTIAKESLQTKIEASLHKNNIPGASVSIATSETDYQTLCFGESVKGKIKTTSETLFEIASLSKTVASAFAIEYFKRKKISLQTPVNELLAKTNSTFRIQSKDPQWANAVTILNLMKHNALNMHYVNGIPANQKMPNVIELINGNTTYGYEPVVAIHQPGTAFQYSGGGFLVLEHLLEELEGVNQLKELTRDFFKQLDLKHLTFEQSTQKGLIYANGYLANGNEVEGTRKMFPAFAAGAMGTAGEVAKFLSHLTTAYHSLDGSGPISHDTAIEMLNCLDQSSQNFMGVNLGAGVFTAEAGANRLAIHQGANDGYRCLYVYCYDGPNRHQGFVILCNADLNGVLFVAEAAQLILKELNWSGVDITKFKNIFDPSKIPQEQIVNLAYKDLVFKSFIPDLPEEIIVKGPRDPMADWNLAVGGEILEVSNQRFARAENMISAHLPIFDPELYGRQGKIMDSWESVRHNQNACDTLVFRMKKPSTVHFVSLSTAYHNGNHPQAVMVEGRARESDPWQIIVPKVNLEGHSLKHVQSLDTKTLFQWIRVSQYPDGGFSRLGLFNNQIPEHEKNKFKPVAEASSIPNGDSIPHSKKPLAPIYKTTPEIVKMNWSRLKKGDLVDIASSAFGGKIVRASNEHYGPAAQVISPFPPIHMFDGSESARSRVKGHFEEVEIELGRPSKIERIEINFKFFVNNNPFEVSVFGKSDRDWIPLVEKTNVKFYAGNQIRFEISRAEIFKHVKFVVYPDGGMNRVHVLTYQHL